MLEVFQSMIQNSIGVDTGSQSIWSERRACCPVSTVLDRSVNLTGSRGIAVGVLSPNPLAKEQDACEHLALCGKLRSL